MITIIPIRNDNQALLGFSVTGHANSGRHGQDIVCAAVSVLAHTAIFGLERQLERAISLEIAEGKMVFELVEPPDTLTDTILGTILLGFEEIAKNYHKFVRIL